SRVEDRLRNADGSGLVFDPNPVVTSGDTTLTDMNDADSPVLTAQLFDRTLKLLDGSGFLRGPYFAAGSSKGRDFQPSLRFAYTRSNPHFEEVMAYYHITEAQLYLQSILGTTRVAARPIVCDAHGTPDDAAFFSPATGEITLGDGGVDAGEDA